MVNIRINKTLGPHMAGELIRVDCDDEGTPLDAYWWRRLLDARHDGCCAIEKPTTVRKRRRKSSKEG